MSLARHCLRIRSLSRPLTSRSTVLRVLLGCSLGVLGFLLVAQSVAASDVCFDPVGRELQCTCPAAVVCRCPDDYCPKPLPCPPCPVRVTADDYCAKPMPCIPCLCLKPCPDDYCEKPLPRFCWPVNREYYRCPPGTDAAAVSVTAAGPATTRHASHSR